MASRWPDQLRCYADEEAEEAEEAEDDDYTVTTHPVEARQDDARRVLVNADGGRGEGGRGGEGGNGGRDENKKRETKRWQEAERADATV